MLKKLLGLSLIVFHLIHLLYFNKRLQLGGQCEKSLLSYQGMSGIEIEMFLILTVGNNRYLSSRCADLVSNVVSS